MRLTPGDQRTFGTRHLHGVTNAGSDPAVSLHVYAPKLVSMTNYRAVDGALEVVEEAHGRGALVGTGAALPPEPGSDPARTIDEVLSARAVRLHRFTPAQAEARPSQGASSSTSGPPPSVRWRRAAPRDGDRAQRPRVALRPGQ